METGIRQRYEPGDYVNLSRDISNFYGLLKKGTPVQIIGIGPKGYDICGRNSEEESEIKITECGWEL